LSAAEGEFPSSRRWGKTAARESERDTYGGRERQKRERESEDESEREKKRAGGSRYICLSKEA